MRDPESPDSTPPSPSPDDTVRLSAGIPADPYATQRLNLSKDLGIDTTQKLPVGNPVAASDPTLEKALKLFEPPIRRQKVDLPVGAEGQTREGPLRPEAVRPFGWKLPAAVGLLVVLGGIAYLAFSQQSAPPPLPAATATVPTEPVPPSVQIYLEQAKVGDTHAMRMLGVCYYNGLNVPQDREKGLYWYRKAAEKGSDAARAELNQIEGGR